MFNVLRKKIVKKLPPPVKCWNCEESSVRADDHGRPICEECWNAMTEWESCARCPHKFRSFDGDECPACGFEPGSETEVCPECKEREVLCDYPYDAELQFGGRMCVDCFHGEKDRECVDCGGTFNPKEDDTVRRCSACYDARERGFVWVSAKEVRG